MTFHGKPRADHHVMEHVHESPWVMLVPLFVLAAGSVLAGVVFNAGFVGESMHSFWTGGAEGEGGYAAILKALAESPAIEAAHHAPVWVKFSPLVVAVLGIAIAYYMYMVNPAVPQRLARSFRGLYLFLLNKWYFDELYDWLFVRTANWLGYGFWKSGDGAIIDGVGPDGVAAATQDLARRVSRVQTGYLYHYAFAIVIGVVAFISWYLFMQAW